LKAEAEVKGEIKVEAETEGNVEVRDGEVRDGCRDSDGGK
jgi:hypothetical protein